MTPRQIQEQARDLQREVNAMRRDEGRPPTYDTPTRDDLERVAARRQDTA